MELKNRLSIHNRFDIEVIDARTGEIKQKAQAHNIITNNLWSCLCSTNQNTDYYYFYQIYWGSGTGTPSASDTDMFTYEGKINAGTPSYNTDYASRVASCTRSIQLDETTSVGVEITEVGIGTSSGNNPKVCTHAMLEDMNGNPITIEKTNVDIINIYATVFIHWSASSEGSMQWGNDGFRVWMFGIQKNVSSYNFGRYLRATKELNPYYRTGNVSNDYFNQLGDFKENTMTGSTANKKIEIACARYPVADMNVGGIGAFFMGGYQGEASYILPVEDFYEGDDITNEAVGTGDGSNKRFTLDFDFPEDIEVFVNGVKKTSGVTFRRICNPPVDREGQAYGKAPQLYVRRLRDASTTSKKELISYTLGSYQCNENVTGGYKHYFPLTAGWIIENCANIIGFASIKNDGAGKVYGSNDLSNWVLLADANAGTVTLTGADQNYKYFKNTGSADARLYWNEIDDCAAIIFDAAPANGDVITANYHTPYVAKDADHVFDLKVTFQFGEYSE